MPSGSHMKIFFLNYGNSSISGGFSSYSKFLSELDINDHMIKFSDFGTSDRNSINMFFRTIGLEKMNILQFFFHRLNRLIFLITFFVLLLICLFSDSKIWVQSSYMSRSKILRILALKLGKKGSLLIDVRDKEFLPYVNRFSKFKFISCGDEINEMIAKVTEKVFDLKTPLSREDVKLIEIVKNSRYVVYAHGIQPDKSPEQLLKFLEALNDKIFLVVICGRIKSSSNKLVQKILNHKKIKYIGNLEKVVLLPLLKSSGGLLITGENEGVPRILQEAKKFSVRVITPKKQAFLSNYDNAFTFEEFAKAISREDSLILENNIDNYKIANLVKFIFED